MIIDAGNVFTKVHRYRLQRPDYIININVHEVILGADFKFCAVPVQALGQVSKNADLSVEGETEYEAVEKLVDKIQKLSKDEIFPKTT